MPSRLDRGTRIYATVLAVLVLVIVIGYRFAGYSPRLDELNELLATDPELANYPYRFKVIEFDADKGIAVVTSPRSPIVPATRAIGILFPKLAGRPADDPEVQAAQKDLARHQARARKLLLAQPDVKEVIWQLDRQWYQAHGVPIM